MRSLQLPRGRKGLKHELDRCQCPTYVTAWPAIGGEINDLTQVDFNLFNFQFYTITSLRGVCQQSHSVLRNEYVNNGKSGQDNDRSLCIFVQTPNGIPSTMWPSLSWQHREQTKYLHLSKEKAHNRTHKHTPKAKTRIEEKNTSKPPQSKSRRLNTLRSFSHAK